MRKLAAAHTVAQHCIINRRAAEHGQHSLFQPNSLVYVCVMLAVLHVHQAGIPRRAAQAISIPTLQRR